MWLIYSILCAFSDALANLFNKQLVSKKQDPISLSYFIHGIGALSFLLIAILQSKKIFEVSPNLLLWIILTAISAAAAGVIILVALKKGDLSLLSPIQTVTPLMVLVISIFFLSESPRPIGLAGIGLIVVGGIYLDKDPKERFSSIIKRIFTYRPALLAVLAAMLYALAAVFDKGGLELTTAGLWALYIYSFIFIFLTPVVIIRKAQGIRKLSNNKTLLGAATLFSIGAVYLQLLAIQTKYVSYVLSIKRLSSLIAVLLAHYVLKEKRALFRLRGAIIMVIGAILIGLS
jgi:transporter family protein